MKHSFACRSPHHELSRRRVLQTALGAAGLAAGLGDGLGESLLAAAVKKQKKQVLFLWLDGAMSQFESWDPKPGTQYGGPFRSIATSLLGVHVSELMPKMSL